MQTEHRSKVAALPILAIGSAVGVVLICTASRYGYHRDELYFRAAGEHLAWGYVDQPPLTPALARIGIAVFGDSPLGIRVIPAVITVVTVLTAGLLAREMRSRRGGQVVAAASTAVAAALLQTGHLLSTPTTDILVWLVAATIVTRMLADEDPRWWVPLGAVIGVGMLNKYTVVLLVAVLGAAVLAVGPRAVLRSGWVVVGALVAVVIASPNLLWQWRNDFPMFSVAEGICVGDGVENRLLFLPMQAVTVGALLVPICVAGMLRLWRDPMLRYARCFGLAYPLAVGAMLIVGGKFYYTFGLLLVVLIAGAQPAADWARTRLKTGVLVAAVVVTGLLNAVVMLPLLPAGSMSVPNAINKEQGEQTGWPALAATVRSVWDALPPEQRPAATIVTSNYGEAGAIGRYGPDVGLPQAYSGHMSFYDWGPPPAADTGRVLLVTGDDAHGLPQKFARCRVAATIDNGLGIDNDEQGGKVWLCDPPGRAWSTIWPEVRRYS